MSLGGGGSSGGGGVVTGAGGAALALEGGGNLAATKADLDALIAANHTDLAALLTKLTAVGAQLPAAVGQQGSAASLSVVGPSNKSLATAESTPTGQPWSYLLATVGNTIAGTLVVPAAAGQTLRRLSGDNTANAATTYILVYSGPAPATINANTNLIGVIVAGASNVTNTQSGGDYIGGLAVPSGVTLVATTSLAAFTAPANSPRIFATYGV